MKDLLSILNSSEVIDTRDFVRKRSSRPLTITVTEQRITFSISREAIAKAGISIDDKAKVVFSKDGSIVMIENTDDGLTISSPKDSNTKNLTIRLTNKKEAYPDFLEIYKKEGNSGKSETDRVVVINDEIQYHPKERRMICDLKRR